MATAVTHPGTTPDANPEHPNGAGRAVLSSFVGTAIEWYDFFIYGTGGRARARPQFFPGGSDLAGTLAAFATLAGRLRRPPLRRRDHGPLRRPDRPQVHAGRLPDAHGRRDRRHRPAAQLRRDVWAPILLVVLRFVQGIGVGGEWGARRADGDRARAEGEGRPLRRSAPDGRPGRGGARQRRLPALHLS